MELSELIKKANATHEIAEQYFATHTVPDDVLREYKGKVAQYENMYTSLEMMKKEVKTEDAVNGLIGQQKHVLELCIEFETNIIK